MRWSSSMEGKVPSSGGGCGFLFSFSFLLKHTTADPTWQDVG